MRRAWLIPRRKLAGAGMAADDEEAALKNNSGADALAFASALLGGGYITDEEGAASK